MMELSEFIRLIFSQSSATYCIVTHRSADLDATASAIALREALVKLGRKAYILMPEGLDNLSKYFIDSLGINETIYGCSDYVECGYYVVVDTASRDQLGCYSSIKDFILIDHHEVNSLVNDALIVTYEPARKATSEVITQILLKLGISLEPNYLTLLIGGILYDSRSLQLADQVTFGLMSRLIELGGDYVRARNMLVRRNSLDYAERVARLKGMSRAGIYRAGKYLVAITCIGAFEGGVLKALLDNGADIAIAVTYRDEGIRVTIRVSELTVKEVGRPLGGELARYLANRLGGSGGGHSLAGGAYVKAEPIECLLKCIREYLTSVIGGFRVIDSGRWITECGGSG